MFKNKPNDEEFDLSEMIDEYEEDSELRKKIEAMKQQSQHAPVNEDIIEEAVETDSALVPPYSKSLTDTRELPRYEESFNRNTFIDADEAVDATRVMSMEAETEDDSDKTLVIMDNQKQRIFETEADDDQDGSIYMYDNREVDEEEITEEDIEEFLGDEEKTKKAKKSVDPNKMNKMITYVITGIVAVCLVVGVGFGVKMLIDNFNTEDTATTNNKKEDNKKEETNKPTDKKDDKKENSDTNDTNGNNGQTTPPPVDNSKRIAEINGMIKGYNTQIEELQSYIKTSEDEIKAAQEEIKAAETESSQYDATIKDYEVKCDTATSSLSVAEKTLDNAKSDAEANPEDEEKQEVLKAAQKAFDDANESKTALCSTLQSTRDTKANVDAKKTEAETKKATAENNKANYLNQIQDLQNKIQELQNERDTLQ